MGFKTKNDYQQMVIHYKTRRKALKEKFPDWRKSKWELEEIKHLSRKIAQFNLMIRKINEREKKIETIAGYICEFLDIPLMGAARPLRNTASVSSKNKTIAMARHLLYKYALENGCKGLHVSMWVGGDKKTAGIGRLRFTRSFKHNSENKRTWDNFKSFIKINYSGGSGYLKAA